MYVLDTGPYIMGPSRALRVRKLEIKVVLVALYIVDWSEFLYVYTKLSVCVH